MGLNNSDERRRSSRRSSVESSVANDKNKKSDRITKKLNALYKEGVSLNDFHVLNFKIGEGGFAKVMKVRHVKTREIFACKVLSKRQLLNERQVVNIFIERGILIRLRHPFIVSLQYAFQTKEKLFFVMDYCAGGDFFHYLQQKQKFSERITRFYAAEICLALEALHNCDIIHRDLKPENILITKEGHLKITDFGLSKWGGNRRPQELRAQTFLGSAPYLAPEILDLQTKEYTKAVDWWAFGVLIMEMLTGLPAFYEHNTDSNYKRILHESVAFKSYLSRLARSIILDLLEKDPATRLKEASEVKKHDFFERTDWVAIENMTAGIPKGVGCLSQDADEYESGSSDERISDYYQSRVKSPQDEEKDASTKIKGDPFLGFSYLGKPNHAAMLNAPEETFRGIAVQSKKSVPDFRPIRDNIKKS